MHNTNTPNDERLKKIVEETVRKVLEATPRPKYAQEDDLMNVQELTDYLDYNYSAVYKMISKKKIPHIKIGKILFRKSEIDLWLSSHSVKAEDESHEEF